MKNNLNRKGRRAEKFRGYSPVRAVGGEAEHTKVGVEKGFGPRHGANAKEGDDLTKVNTDTVPAMLTPREAVLNRNAAELAGRPEIEALNKEGNLLAQKGVDLAAEENNMKSKLNGVNEGAARGKPIKKLAGGDASLGGMQGRDFPHPFAGQMHNQGAIPGGYGYQPQPAIEPGGMPGAAPRNFPHPNAGMMHPGAGVIGQPGGGVLGQPGGGILGQPRGGVLGQPAGGTLGQPGGFYPSGQGLGRGYGFAEGSTEVPGGIGAPNPQKSYSTDPVDFKAPDLSGFLRDMAAEAKKRGISEAQMAGIAKQFAGMGGGGAPAGGDAPYDMLGGQYASFSGGAPGYQDGISEVGYPPLIAPNAKFDYDRGGWVGAYDPRYSFPGYAAGDNDIEPPILAGNRDFFGPGFDTAQVRIIGGHFNPNAGHGFSNRSSYNPGFGASFMGHNTLGYQPPPWSAGFSQGPTMIPTTLGNSGYPMGVPVQGPDQNVQGVGRTHNLRQNQ